MGKTIIWIVGIIILGIFYFGVIYMALKPQIENDKLRAEITSLKLQIQKQELQKQLEGAEQ